MRRQLVVAARGERGQVLPALLLLALALLAGGVLLFQVGWASTLRAGAVTAADAAALAGAQDVRAQLEGGVLGLGLINPSGVNERRVRRAAADWAQRNGGTLTAFDYDPSGPYVRVEVESAERMDGGSGLEDTAGQGGRARARAELEITYTLGLPISVGPPGAGAGLPEDELALLADRAGAPVRDDSALRRYGARCGGGQVDVAHLTDDMKVAILRAEDLLGRGLAISSGHRTPACQAAITDPVGGRVAAPGMSLHNYGMAIDTPDHAALATVARQVGLCQPFPSDDYVHFSLASGPECGGRSGVLGPGGAFPGGLGSFAEFDVWLVPWDR
ncbi:MAG: hypothetical protein GEU81_01650 [Nitriliruptorales bacterium]|nr:hypothetical protein [Nitriliruptorales bacterium]